MKKYWKKILLAVLIVVLASVLAVTVGEVLTFEALKKNTVALTVIVQGHYAFSLVLFGLVFLATAFFVPGALILTVAGGFLFGVVPGAAYASMFSTLGSALAFLCSRYLIGRWVQRRYARQLKRFNEEILRYGSNYLFALRITPVMPSFLINYLSGLTHMPLRRFVITTFLGITPGAFIYSLAGGQLSSLERPGDIFSSGMLAGFCLIAALALVPVFYARLLRLRRGR